jgi:hypothetical protein
VHDVFIVVHDVTNPACHPALLQDSCPLSDSLTLIDGVTVQDEVLGIMGMFLFDGMKLPILRMSGFFAERRTRATGKRLWRTILNSLCDDLQD